MFSGWKGIHSRNEFALTLAVPLVSGGAESPGADAAVSAGVVLTLPTPTHAQVHALVHVCKEWAEQFQNLLSGSSPHAMMRHKHNQELRC